MPDNEYLQGIYNDLKDNYDIGTIDEFSSAMQDEDNLKGLYNDLKKTRNLGDYDTFKSDMGFGETQIQPTEQQQVEETVQSQPQETKIEQPKEKPQPVETKQEEAKPKEKTKEELEAEARLEREKQAEEYQKEHPWADFVNQPGNNVFKPVWEQEAQLSASIPNKFLQEQEKLDAINSPLATEREMKHRLDYAVDQFNDILDEFFEGTGDEILKLGNEARNAEIERVSEKKEKEPAWLVFIRGLGRTDKTATEMAEQTKVVRAGNVAKENVVKKGMESLRKSVADLTGVSYNSLVEPVKQEAKKDNSWFGKFLEWSTNRNTSDTNVDGGEGGWLASLLSIPEEEKEDEKANEAYDIVKNNASEVGQKYNTLLSEMSNQLGLSPQRLNEELAKQAYSLADYELNMAQIAENTPSGRAEYYLERSFENSVLGKMISAAVLTPEQYDIRTMATQLYGQDLTAWDRAGMSALTFLWDSALMAGYGKFGSSLGNAVFSRAATVLIGRGMPRSVVMRYVNFLCANNYWARAGKNALTGAVSGSQMLGLYNLTSELASQNASGKYDWEAAKQSYLDGVGTGTTLSVVGAPVGAWAQTLTGATKVFGKGASFVAEGMAFSASSQLQKMVKGEDLDPWLDSFVDSYIQLAFLKGLSTGGLKTMYKAFTDPKALLQAEDLGGYHLSQEQVKQLRDYGGGLFKLLTSMTPSEYSEYYNRNVDTKGLTRNKEVNIPQENRTPKQQALAEKTQQLRAEMKRFLENENIDWEAKQAVINTLGGWLDPVNRTTPTTVRQERDLDTGKTIISVLDTNGREISKTEIDSDGDIQGEYDKARQQVVNAQLDAVGIGNPVAWDEVKRAIGNTISSDKFMEAQLNAAEVARMRESYIALKANGASRAELQEAYDTYLESKLSLDETSARALDLYFQMVAGDALPPTADNTESSGGGGGNLPVAPVVPVRADDNPRGVGNLAELSTTLKERQGEELLAQAAQDPVNALQKAREMVEDENTDYTEQDYEDLKNYINVARTQTLNSLYDEGYTSGNAAEQTQIYRESIEAYEDMVNEWTDEELTRLEENPQEELSKILNAALDPDSPVTIDDYIKAENYAKATQKQLGVKESFSGTPKRTKKGKSAQELLDDWTLSQITQATPVDALKMANEWLNDSKNPFDVYDFQAVQQYIIERELAKIPKARAEGRSITDPVDKEQAVSLYAKQYASIWRNRANRGDLTRANDDPEAFLEEYLNRSLDGERPITQEDFEEVSKYIHALEVIRGICERELQDARQDDLEYVRSLELKDDKGEPLGRIIDVTMKDGEEVNVVSGDIVLADDGHTIDGSRSSETVVVLYEDGTMAMVSPTQDILRVDGIFSEEEYLQDVSSTQKVMEAQQRRIKDALTREMLPQMKQEAQDAYDDVVTDIIKRTGDEDSARDFIDTINEEGGLDRLIAYADDEEQPDITQEDVELAQRFLQAQAELERVRAIEEDLAKEPQEEIPADTEQTTEQEEAPTTTTTETTTATEGGETPTTESGETPPVTESEQTPEGETANVPDVRKTLSDNGLDEETINSLVTNPKQALADLKGKVSDEVYNIAKEYAELQWVSNLSADKEPDWNSAPTAGAAFDGIVALAGGDTNLALKEAKAVLDDKRKIADKAKKEAEKPGKGKTLVERLADSKKRQDEADKAQEEVRLWSNIVDIPRARQAQKEREALEARRKKAEEEAKKAEEEAKRIQAEKEALKGVPDATIPKADSYEAAQNRGFWNVGGKKVDRQGVLNAPQGIETHVAFAKLDDGSGIATGHVALVSADDLQPSHKRGVKNWKLFTDTQPKDARNTPESIGTIRETAQNLDPAKLTGITNAYQDSMPSVNTRGEVIQGHGRTDAIQQAYEDFPERAAQYKQYLIDHAKEFGIDPEEVAKMEKPVFVNMMDVSDAEAKRWAGFKQGQLESGGYVSLDGKTIAKQMSNKEFSRFISKLMENAGDEDSFAQLLDKNGAKVIMELTKSGLISNAQNRSAIDANGHLVPAASNDIANLLLGRMFGDDVNTATIFQSSSFPKKAQRAILSSIYKDFATKDPDQTIAPEISNAIKAFSELTADESFMSAKDFPTAKKLAESFSGQARFDADGNITYPLKDYSNFAVTLAALFKGGTQKDIQATLTDIISLVQGNKQSSLFDENGGDATPEPPKSLREAVKQVLDIDYNENEQQKRVKKNEGQEGNSPVDVNNASSAAGEQTNEASSNGGEPTQTGAEPADNTAGTTSVSGQGQQGEVKNPYNLPTDEEYDKRIAEAKENGGNAELVITLKNQAQSIRNNRTWLTLGFGRMRLEQLLKDSKIKPTEQDLADIEKINKAQEEYEKGFPERSARRSEIKKLLIGLDRQIANEKDPVKKAELQKQRDDLADERRELEEIDGMIIGNLSETNTSENTPSTQVTEQPSPTQEAIQEAEKQVETNPTEAQTQAGNYKKGHFTIDGHDVTIENPKGSVRRGKDADGKEWETKMNNTYGYIKGTKGVDGDHIDVFLSDNPDEGDIYVVDQVNPKTGEFDEHKVMYGFNSEQEARDAYLSNYEKDWKGLGNITKVSREEFKKWIDSSTRKTKPFAEYKSVKPSETLDETPTEAKPLLNENDNIPTAMNKAAGKTLVKVNKSDKGDYLTVFTDIGYKGGKAKTVNYTHFGLGEGFQIEKAREDVGKFVAKLKANGFREATSEELKQIEEFIAKNEEKNNGKTRFRSEDSNNTEVTSTPEEISEHIDNLQKRFKNKVTQVNSLDEVTDERARKKIEQDQKNGTKKTKGWYDPNTGEVVLYMPNVTSVEDAERTIIHETKGHKGLRALLGDNFNKSMDKIYNLLPKEVREKIKVTADEKYDGDLIEATEEHLSETAEKNEMPSWWEKVCATVKDYIRKAGFDLEMTDSDVKYLLWKAEQKLAEGNALDKAEDIAMRNQVERENIKLRSENPFANASAEELDNAYFDAYDKGDRARMREIIDEVARRRGYSNVEDWRYYHAAPMRTEEVKDDEGSLYTWTLKDEADDNPHRANHISDSYYASVDINGSRDESMSAIQSALDKIKQGKDPTVTIYRAVPKNVKESKMRNGDWVTFSKAYAENHGEHVIGIGDYRIIKEKVPASQVYWDGNDINEWGFDDGKDYKYKNTENNRKLNNTITFDDEGNIIPPSKRFDSTKESVRFREDDNENNGNIIVNENGGDVILPEDSDIDFGDDYDSAEEAVKNSTKISPTKTAKETRQFLMNEAERNVEALQKTLSAIIDEGNGSKKILRLQRDYDRETLKSFVDEAKEMLTDGTLDTATKADLRNLISTIEGSIGANVKEQRFAGKKLVVPKTPDANLEKSAKRLARIMQTNQFRKAKNILDNIIGMKGTKIGDDRIVRQKDLDVDGQNLMKTIRQNKDLDEKTLEQKITETENMLDSSDDANRKAAEIALQGLIYARQYRDMVTEQIQATRDVVEALNTAKKEKRPKSYIQALEDKLFDIKQNTIDKMNNLSCSLVKELGASVERAKEFANEQRKIVEEVHHNANSDMEGRPYTEQNDETKVQKVLNHPFVQFFLEPLGTFNTMLKLFGNKAVDGRGYLWNRYIPKGIKASVGEANDRFEGQDILGKKAAEVFGKDGMRWSDLFKMTRKTLPIKVKYEDGGEKKEHDITIGTGMYVYMVNKMIDGKVKLRDMGIEEEDVERIKEALDPKLVEIADWVQDEFLVNWRNKYNPTYERIYGASMDAIENYVPLRINERSRYKKKDINDQNSGIVLPSTVTGAIMKRTFNTTPIDMRTDAVDVILSHVYEMAHWGNFSEYAHDINVLLSYKRFENQVHNMTSVYGGGDILWKKFERVAAMAGGVDYGRSGLRSQDEWVRKAASGVTRAQIAFRLNTAFKQVLSAPAFWSQASIPNLVKAQLHPFKNFKWAMENLPLFEKRWKSRQIGDTRLSDADSTGSLITSKFVDRMSKIGMLPNVFVDAMTVATGAKAVYETSYARYKEEGYEDEIAKKKALLDASVSYNESQQSSENMFVAPSQVDKTLFSTALTAFRNAPYAYGRLVWESLESARRRKFSKGYKENSIAFMQKQALREIGIDPDKAEGAQKDQAHYIAERRYKRQEMKDAVNLVTFGYIVPTLWNMGSHLPYFILGQDDDKKLDLLKHDLIKGTWGAIEGLAMGNIMSDAVDAAVNGGNLNSLTYYNLPLISEIDRIKDLFNTDVSQAVNAIVNLLFEAGVGVNPQIMEDTALAIYDACKQDTFTMHEAVMLIGKIMQMPQNQLDELYFDKIGMSGKEAGKKAPAEIAERYAINKFKREHLLTEWAMSDKEKEKQMERYIKRADAKIKERCNGLGVREINKKYDEYQAIHDKTQEEVNSITKLAKKEPQKAKAQADSLMKTKDWVIYQAFKKYDSKYVDKIVKEWINSDKVEKADKFQDAFITNKGKLVNDIDSVLNTSNK